MKLLVLLFVATTLAACHKTADPPAAGSAAPVAIPTPRPASDGDRVEVLARHLPAAGKEDLDSDPVVVRFDKVTVTAAHFDPANLEGGTATVELDPASIKTGNDERDRDLQSPDYLNVASFATITIDVAHVKKQSATTYSADATVACHGVTKTYAVTFEVLATTADSVRIKGEHTFSRVDFAVGIDPATDPTERIAAPLIIQWVLTLHR